MTASRQQPASFFYGTANFNEAFPEIKHIGVTIRVNRPGVAHDRGQTILLDKFSLQEHFDCVYPHCRHGGFDVGDMLRQIVRRKSSRR
jgi:hypothetical protein